MDEGWINSAFSLTCKVALPWNTSQLTICVSARTASIWCFPKIASEGAFSCNLNNSWDVYFTLRSLVLWGVRCVKLLCNRQDLLSVLCYRGRTKMTRKSSHWNQLTVSITQLWVPCTIKYTQSVETKGNIDKYLAFHLLNIIFLYIKQKVYSHSKLFNKIRICSNFFLSSLINDRRC